MKKRILRIDETGTYLDEEEVPVYVDVDGVEIFEEEPFWRIGGEIYSEKTLENMKEYAHGE